MFHLDMKNVLRQTMPMLKAGDHVRVNRGLQRIHFKPTEIMLFYVFNRNVNFNHNWKFNCD